MQVLNLEIPGRTDIDLKDMVCFVAAKLYESGRLTLGQAAKMASMRTVEFAEVLSEYGVSLINYPATDISIDVRNA